MKRMCAWCGKELDRAQVGNDVPLTHGVCGDCRQKFFAAPRGQGGDKPEASGGPRESDAGHGEG